MPKYQSLEARAVRETVTRLEGRIRARFPQRHLPEVCAEVGAVIDEFLLSSRPRFFEAIVLASRVLIAMLVGSVVLVLALLLHGRARLEPAPTAFEWASVVESSVNDLVFVALAIWFLWHVPTRVLRAHYLRSLHKLRSLAHIIDMHQLTKDPERLTHGYRKTHASVDIGLDYHQLHHYLDYCSEMLSLVGKAAALFAERSGDDVVLSTVEAIEELTSALSHKIWQKISLISQRADMMR